MSSPLFDNIIVREDPLTKAVASGIILTSRDVKNEPRKGTVIAVGEGRALPDGNIGPLTVKVGDRVIFTAVSGNKIQLDDEVVIIMRECEIVGIINE